jgi:hypothetical protein
MAMVLEVLDEEVDDPRVARRLVHHVVAAPLFDADLSRASGVPV